MIATRLSITDVMLIEPKVFGDDGIDRPFEEALTLANKAASAKRLVDAEVFA